MRTIATPGWYDDPYRRHQHRYFDGARWTEHVANRGRSSLDPVTADTPWPGRGDVASGAARPATTGPGPTSWPDATPRAREPARSSRTATVAVFGGAGLLFVGAFLPWVEASVGFVSVEQPGTDGDGVLTLLCGIAAAVLFWVATTPAGRIVTLVSGLLAGAVALYDIVDINNKAEELSTNAGVFAIEASVGVGLWLTMIGAVAVIVGAALAIREAA